ncbi:MAG: hypothetical protein K0S47_1409 [Herbinix sp.]|jgi:ATP-binding cassette subfamily B protein|nr:hypothetical protein [Herbinix sp.]
MKNQKQKAMSKMNIFHVFFELVPKIIKVSPWIFLCGFILNLIDGAIAGSMTFITQNFLDQATGYVSQKNGIVAVIYAMVGWGTMHIFWQMLNGVSYFMNMMYLRKTQGYLSLEINKKTSRLAAICYENPEILDDINKAEQGKNCAASFVNAIMITLNVHIPYFICMTIYLYKVKPILIVSLLLIFLPTLLTQILRAKVFSKAEDLSAPVRRECFYYESCMIGREYYKETRILGAFPYFKKKYVDLQKLLNQLIFHASAKSDLAELGMKLLSLIGYIGIIVLLFASLMNREISVGAFAAIFSAVGQMFSRMEEVVYRHFGSAARDFGMVRNYLQFLHREEREGIDIEIPEDTDIALQGVAFTYPNAENKAIDNVSFTIHHGETIAIVGENGSGKSTLVRLITGLYLPDDGDIFYGSANTKDLAIGSLYKKFSVVFQKYQQYQMTLRENIGIGDALKRAEDETLDYVCNQAGIDRNDSSFFKGYDTMLSREFDGTDLSGGQWQRIAIARSLFRPHQIIVLDEPTAAIDPIEETKIYHHFAEITKGKTALIVTHRLGSVKLADRILVMKHGKLVEQGVHKELVKAQGEYARLYMSQEQWYRT